MEYIPSFIRRKYEMRRLGSGDLPDMEDNLKETYGITLSGASNALVTTARQTLYQR
jgi:hypothetical protein